MIVLEKLFASFPYGAGIAAIFWRLRDLLRLVHLSQRGYEYVSTKRQVKNLQLTICMQL